MNNQTKSNYFFNPQIRNLFVSLMMVLMTAIAIPNSLAQGKKGTSTVKMAGEPTAESNRKLVQNVLNRLLLAAKKLNYPKLNYKYPIQVVVDDGERVFSVYEMGADELNAFADNLTIEELEKYGINFQLPRKPNSSKKDRVPILAFTPAILKFLSNDEDLIASTVGHELCHLIFDHVTPDKNINPNVPKRGFGRAQEEEADRKGIELALAAGFSRDKLRESDVKYFAKNPDFKNFGDYSAISNYKYKHPTNLERLAYLDNKHGEFWQAYHSFVNGGYFLDFEDYKTAESEFDKVIKANPISWEAYNNRGYARLMQYFDELEWRNIQSLGIGYLIVGGYYKKPSDREPRGFDKAIWNNAVDDLLKAEKLYAKSSLAKANLGVAYLISPDNPEKLETKKENLKKSQDYFRKAIDLIKEDDLLLKDEGSMSVTLAKAAVYNNAAVAALAANDLKTFEELNSKRELLLGSLEESLFQDLEEGFNYYKSIKDKPSIKIGHKKGVLNSSFYTAKQLSKIISSKMVAPARVSSFKMMFKYLANELVKFKELDNSYLKKVEDGSILYNFYSPLANAFLYNQALKNEQSEDYDKGYDFYAEFLRFNSESSKYRELAKKGFERSAEINGKPATVPTPKPTQKRGVYSVNFGNNSASLGTTFDKNLETLLGCKEAPLKEADEKGLVKYFLCQQNTVEIAVGGTRQEILLIRLFGSLPKTKGTTANQVTIEIAETGASQPQKVLVGMPEKEFAKIAGKFEEIADIHQDLKNASFKVYPELNLYVKFTANKVTEILVRPCERIIDGNVIPCG